MTLVITDGEFGWRPCNWWGRWLSLLGILIFAGKGRRKKGGDGVDMEGVFVIS